MNILSIFLVFLFGNFVIAENKINLLENTELLNEILGYLEQDDLIPVSMVSNFFNQIAIDNARKRQNRDIPDFEGLSIKNLYKISQIVEPWPSMSVEDYRPRGPLETFLICDEIPIFGLCNYMDNDYILFVYANYLNNRLEIYSFLVRFNYWGNIDIVRLNDETLSHIEIKNHLKYKQKYNVYIVSNNCLINVDKNLLLNDIKLVISEIIQPTTSSVRELLDQISCVDRDGYKEMFIKMAKKSKRSRRYCSLQ